MKSMLTLRSERYVATRKYAIAQRNAQLWDRSLREFPELVGKPIGIKPGSEKTYGQTLQEARTDESFWRVALESIDDSIRQRELLVGHSIFVGLTALIMSGFVYVFHF